MYAKKCMVISSPESLSVSKLIIILTDYCLLLILMHKMESTGYNASLCSTSHHSNRVFNVNESYVPCVVTQIKYQPAEKIRLFISRPQIINNDFLSYDPLDRAPFLAIACIQFCKCISLYDKKAVHSIPATFLTSEE